MDFITGLPMTWRQHDSIMVVVEKLTKASNFIPVKSMYKANSIAKIFMKDIFRLHGFPKEIISDRDTKFTFTFWKKFVCIFGYQVELQHHLPSSN